MLYTMPEETIFHKIVRGEAPCHKVWEDENFLAFLSIFPNTPGVTVVIPKEWQPSDVAQVDSEVVCGLMRAVQTVSHKITRALPDVGRVGVVFEGFGVDYLHAKLFPMHGTADMDQWRPIENARTEVYETYPGYISSHDAARADDEELARIAAQIRDADV